CSYIGFSGEDVPVPMGQTAQESASRVNWRLFTGIVALIVVLVAGLYFVLQWDVTAVLAALVIAIFVALIVARVYALTKYEFT
ncbi:hypothetical protein RBH26_18780, partial [Natronolimnohabitans sp. A-GB9]|uniref:hypothetical protein n=1 Tax=Natronolimnohabitans sp. A-GB9 TaxID=3069757 RepID=UPI0027B5BEFF